MPPLISLHALTGIRTADTMQVKVRMGNHQINALLDSGSTHNFISGLAAQHIGLNFINSRGVNVHGILAFRQACSLERDWVNKVGHSIH